MTAYEAWVQHLQGSIVATIGAISRTERDGVYVIFLDLGVEDEDTRRVTLTVAWNTTRHLRAQQRLVEADQRRACEWVRYVFAEPEARVVGSTPEDVALRTAWLREAGLDYDDEHRALAVTSQDERIWDTFLASVVEIVRGLHADGSIARSLGHDVPVLLDAVHEDEEYVQELNRSANPHVFHVELDRWSARGYAD